MKHKSVILWYAIVVTLWHCGTGVNSQYFPPNLTQSLLPGTDITASSTCQASGTNYNCNYCASSRNFWPTHIDILKTLDSGGRDCSSSLTGDTPVPTDNGILVIDQNSVNCSFSQSVPAVNNNGYTLSFWMKFNCDDCHLFTFRSGGDIVTVKISNGGRNIVLSSGTQASVSSAVGNIKSKWIYLTLRFFESTMEFYLNGTNLQNSSQPWFPAFDETGTIEFNNYSSTDVISIVDFRFYMEALTDREIEYQFYQFSSPDLDNPPFDCRCSSAYPVLQDDLTCANRTSGKVNTVPFLLMEAHLPVFTIDNNPATSWVTEPTETAWILLTMSKTYQVDGLTIEVNNTVPTFVVIELRSSFVTGQPDPVTVAPSPGNNIITWSAGSTDDIDTRRKLIRRLASSINITFSGHSDASDVFNVVEIKVNRRENCFGNADLYINDQCNCLIITDTTGPDCGTCTDGYYRGPDDFACPSSCNCSSAPGIKTDGQCNQEGGGCLCKTNVEGYHCDTCKHLYYNLMESNPDGCTPCSCDPTGSQSCDDTGTCRCKDNVVELQCNQCASNTYGFNITDFEGCQACGCSTSGTEPNSGVCDREDGSCTCKQFVTGRKCDMCKPGYKDLNFQNSRGCDDCECNRAGSQDITSCDAASGQCLCQYPVPNNLKCNPVFDSDKLEPAFGPLAGGTEVTIRGKLFKHNSTNTQVKVLLEGQNKLLNVTRFEENHIQFETSSINNSGLYKIILQWPQSFGIVNPKDFSKEFDFTFKVNPQITDPMNSTVYRSGGCSVKIKGSNFESVSKAKLIAHIGNTEVLGETCTQVGGSMLNCPSPNLKNYTSVSTVSYGLQLDGLDMYRNLNSFPGARITLIDDPTVDTNNDLTIDNVFAGNLVIKGSNLDKACKDNFEIKLGDDVCPIEVKTSTEVTCKPVVLFPGESKDVELKVYIGNFQSTVGTVKIKSFWATTQFIGIAAGVGAFILLIIIIVIVVKCCRRSRASNIKDRKIHNDQQGLVDMRLFRSLSNESDQGSAGAQRTSQFDSIGPPIIAEQTRQPRKNNYTDMSGMPLDNIESEESMAESFLHKLDSTLREDVHSSLSKRSVIKLGLRCTQKGAEIRVIDGKFQEGPFVGQDATIKTPVADFKGFGEGLLPQWIGTGLAETLRFRDCHQENLHRSCGITIDESRFYVLYPATQRILKEHLRDKNQEFTSFSLIEICQRIAEAMDFLSSNDIVHRDIATRNCVVCAGGVVKISDAAFSWSLFPDEYMFDSERERWLPVRWMAQDSLQYGFYSTATDVWSYGVLMWEVMSRGVLLPYFDIENNEDIKDHIVNGFRLGKPDIVPDEMYALMMSCWDTNHVKRPAFVRIIERLIDILNPTESPTLMYQNQPNEELPEYGNVPDNRPKLPSRANMPAKNGNVNFGYS